MVEGIEVGVVGGEGGGVVESRSFPPFLSSPSTCRGNASRIEMVEAIAAITPSAICRKIPQIPCGVGDMRIIFDMRNDLRAEPRAECGN